MKRLLSVLLVLSFVITLLAGCSNTPVPDNPDTGPSDTGETSDTPAQGNDTEPEYFLEHEEGCNQITFYWYSDGADYEKCDMWIWYPNADGRGYLFHPCEYGAKVVLNVPEEISEVGFIVRKNCSDPGGSSWGDATKDYDGDRFATITGPDTKVYLKPGDKGQYLSDDGGKTLYQAKKLTLAGITALNQIRYNLTPATRITSLDQVKVTDGEREIPVLSLSSLNNEVVFGVITLAEHLDITKTYVLEIEGFEPMNAVPTSVFDSEDFIEKYTYDGDDLGAVIIDGALTSFKVWAPTASEVLLNLYAEGNGGEASRVIPMERLDHGVWGIEAEAGHGTYYTYTVTTSAGTNEAVDPYAKAAGVNGNRGMVVDLSLTDPDGFAEDTYYSDISSYNEAIIWEVHVRDFSNRISASAYPGKYLAFTEHGLTNASGEPAGIDYLVDLGITHVHLQPVYDYATVDESSDEPQFNWGYDPKNYNVPEGSYSTDPYHGEVRITEFKEMVKAVHEAGLGVVMDVVYNHTYDAASNFSAIVPYYYYRYNGSGQLSNGSGCGNETASERVMFRKFMVDSVTYWAKEYHIDGFRFDLMALHDTETMQEIEKAVHAVNPYAVIYGEGWTGGTTTLDSRLQASQANIKNVVASEGAIGAVAVFNDAIRDGLKGSVFDALDKGYINGNPSTANANKVVFGLKGGEKTAGIAWTVPDNGVINYMACHDNNTLWDKLLKSNADASDEDRIAMYRLGASVLMISKGIPFFLAGEEMLRTKGGDHNSYKSSDAVNNIDWDALTEGSAVMEMRDYYKALIAMRRANPFFMEDGVECEILPGNAIYVTYTGEDGTDGFAVVNPGDEVLFTVPDGIWKVLMNGEVYDETVTVSSGEAVVIPPKSVLAAAAAE